MFAEPDFRDPWEDSPFINGNFVHHHHHHPHHHHNNNFHHRQHHPGVGGGSGTCSAEAQNNNNNQQQQHFIPIQVMGENYNNNNNHHRLNKHSFPLMEEEMQEPESFEIKEINRIEIPTIFRQADEPLSRPPTTTVRSTPHPVPPPTMPMSLGHSSPPNNNNNFMDNNNHMSTSPLNSPGHNSSIRHIPIFFEGKPKQQQQQSNHQNNNNNNINCSSQPNQKPASQQQQQQQPLISTPIPLPPANCRGEPEVNQIQKSGPPTPPPRNPHNIRHHHHHHEHANIFSTPSSSAATAAAEEVKGPQRKNPASTASSNNTDDSPLPPPIKRPTPPKSPLEKVQLISDDVRQLEKQVIEFTGLGKTKEYLFLDEMLTRNLIRLDDINVEGREDIRMARKDCINLIQKCISSLENKISATSSSSSSTGSNNNNNSMAVAVIAPAPLVLSPISSQVVKQNNNIIGNLAVPVMMVPTHRSEISIEVNLGEEEEAKNSKIDTSKNQDNSNNK